MADLIQIDLITETSAEEQQKRAKRVMVWSLVISAIIAAVSVFSRLQAGTSLLPSLAPIIVAICSLVAIVLVWRQRIASATILILIGFWGALFFTTLLVSQLGILLAACGFVITLVLVAETTPKYISVGVAINALFAIVLVLLDTFWAGARTPLPDTADVLIPALVALGALIFGFIIVRQLPRYSLRAKLFIANIVVVVFAVLGLTFFIGQSTSNTLTVSIGNNLHSVADIQALNVGNTLAQQINQMQAFAFNQAFQVELTAVNQTYAQPKEEMENQLISLNTTWQGADYTSPIVQNRLNNRTATELLEFRNTFRNYSEVFITDKYGVITASTFRNRELYYGNSEWWQIVERGDVYVSDPIVDSNSRLVYVNLAIPIFARNSFDVLGSMNVTYSLRDLRNIFSTTENDIGATGRLHLLLPNNQLIRMTTYTVEELTPEARQEFDNVQDEEYITLTNTDGAEELVSQVDVYTSADLADIKSLNWRVITGQELQASLAPVFQQQRALTLLGLVVMVVSTIVVIFFGRILVNPIIQLTETAKQFAQGNLDARAQTTTTDELGLLANTFNDMADEMKLSLTNLEKRVADRTQALETSIEVSRELSNILDQKALTGQVVKSIQSAFNYYHVHIYLLDDESKYLVLSGGTGEAGIAMMSAGHKIARGKGLVGQAAEANEVVLVPDVSQDPQWLANPLLPETKSEAAVPISVGSQVLGVLDVQHNIEGGLTSDDTALLQSIAGQVAIALQNARLYQVAQTQAQRNLLINEINQKIQQSVSIDQILQIAAEELGKALDARRTTVQLQQQQLQNQQITFQKSYNGSQQSESN